MNYAHLASSQTISRTIRSLAAHNLEGILVDNGAQALAKIKELIPAGASVMNGASVTLEQIGFVEYLKSSVHGWDNLHAKILAETDPLKQGDLRKQALLSSYYLGSVHAITEAGELVIASNTGSQLPHIVFSSHNLILVVGAQKIVPTLDEALKRLEEYVTPLENQHMQEKYKVDTQLNKIVILKGENAHLNRKITVLIVNEQLGF